MGLKEQIAKDAAAVAAWPESKRAMYRRALAAVLHNPGIVFTRTNQEAE